jgi:hypothetical protein
LLYRSIKLIIEEETCNLILQVAKMVLNARGWENDWKYKITWIVVGNVKCHGLFHIVFVPNGHMPLGGEQVMFGLAHTSWWVYGI